MNPTPPAPPSPTPTSNNGFQQTPSLTQIQQKVRRLTRSPSEAQLTTSDLNNYINTFIVYDFPEHIRTFNLKTSFTFFTNPFQDVYPTDEAALGGAVNNPLYNFQNLYISVHPPFYVGGFQGFWTQNMQQFYGIYPLTNSIQPTGITGDGFTTTFSGQININGTASNIISPAVQQVNCIAQRSVLINSVATDGIGIAVVDVPIVDPNTGLNFPQGNLYDPNSAAYAAALANPPTVVLANNNVDYTTGKFTCTFTYAPAANTSINTQTLPQVVQLPQACLYFSGAFTLRPIPDQVYRVEIQVFQRPTALLANNQAPELEEYWQYISYGASKKILEDRLDMDSVALILPEYEKQERLCLRRTIVQLTNQRTATAYSQQTELSGGNSWWGGTGGPF